MKSHDLALKLAEIGKSLVDIASSMVQSEEIEPVPTQVKKAVKKKASAKSQTQTAGKRNNIPDSTVKSKRINSKKRVNKWVDDGTLFADLKGATPKPKPKTKRPSPIIDVKCTACGKVEKKHKDTIYSVAYRCENCVLSGKIGQ